MTKSIFDRVALAILLSIVVFVAWYSVAADYGYAAVSGTYVLHHDQEISTLVLKPDRTFEQEVRRGGKVERAQGNWRRIGEGGIVFSKEFLKLTGQEVRTDGQADGEVKKRCLGLRMSIKLNPDQGGPIFRKKLFG